VSCVSNLSNEPPPAHTQTHTPADLFRKTIRHIEVGVPCVIMSRSNTSQHCFRWFQMLQVLIDEHKLPTHLITFASCSLEQQRLLMSTFPSSPVHFTGSREVAQKIKLAAPRTLASTGGPNTMVVFGMMTPEIDDALRMSACIENSGQCTALRHVVAASDVSEQHLVSHLDSIFSSAPSKETAGTKECLEEHQFAALLAPLKVSAPVASAGYSQVCVCVCVCGISYI
jgi:acyl-CoA reductase-like NAD-dependent aldehyde dehydrogenase